MVVATALMVIALLIIFRLGFTCLAPMQSLFGMTAIDFTLWLQILLVSSSVLFWLSWRSTLFGR
ncbi:MAG: hypothetical protein L3J28_10725 [Candidatus Polarisedimenticolaceae bacterium]|nr:hypothetical protein [Candidatus Polarisedimenticolaceae bacterium]